MNKDNKKVPSIDLLETSKVDMDSFINEGEKLRKFYLNSSRSYKILAYSVIGIVFLCFVALVLILVVFKERVNTLYAIIPAAIALISLITFMILNKTSIKKGMSNSGEYYQKNYSLLVNKYEYHDDKTITDGSFFYNGELTLNEFESSLYFSELTKSTSRNKYEGKINNRSFIKIDCALGTNISTNSLDKMKTSKDENLAQCLYGRQYFVDCKLQGKDKIILTFPSVSTYSPTNLISMHKFESKDFNLNKEITLYATNREILNKILTKEIVEIINNYKFNNTVNGGFLSINPNGTFLSVNIDETALELPIKQKQNREQSLSLKKLSDFATNLFNELTKEVE